MSEVNEKRPQSSNKCLICYRLLAVGDDKVSDHDHVTGKYKDFAHRSGNINLKLSKKVPEIFHNLKGYDSDLIMQDIGKFDAKKSVIPTGLEK